MKDLFNRVEFYECTFCKDIWDDKDEMLKHSENCIYNPDHKACGTCKHLAQYEVVEGFPYYHCRKHGNSLLEDINGKGLYDIDKECWDLGDLESPINELTEAEADFLRETQNHDETIFLKKTDKKE